MVATNPERTDPMVNDFVGEYNRYRLIAERALAQVPDSALNFIPATGGNSVAMLVYHMSGNLRSRFTDFLTTDGEKPWRDRDDEFANRDCTREEMNAQWSAGWLVLEQQLSSLIDADMTRVVRIRQQPLTVHAALCRSLSHVAYHVGQIVLIARMTADESWRWISIPKGESKSYNANPDREKAPK